MRINEEIHIREVRVTSATGEQLGIMQTRDALRLAEEQHFGLTDRDPKSFADLAEQYHATREQIRQLIAFEMRRLRHPTRRKTILRTLDEED